MKCTYIEVPRPLKVLDTTGLNSPIHTQSYTHGVAATQAVRSYLRSSILHKDTLTCGLEEPRTGALLNSGLPALPSEPLLFYHICLQHRN